MIKTTQYLLETQQRLDWLLENKEEIGTIETWAEGVGCLNFRLDNEVNVHFTGNKQRLLNLLKELASLGYHRDRNASQPGVNQNELRLRLKKTREGVTVYFVYTSTSCQMVPTGEYETIRRPIMRMDCAPLFSPTELASGAQVMLEGSSDIAQLDAPQEDNSVPF